MTGLSGVEGVPGALDCEAGDNAHHCNNLRTPLIRDCRTHILAGEGE